MIRTFSYIFICILFASSLNSFSEAQEGPSGIKDVKVDYRLWESILKKYVDAAGRVDYPGLKENPRELDDLMMAWRDIRPQSLSSQDQKAFWINAYNALTLWVVREHYPVRSIRVINFGLVWELPRKVAGGKYSLGHIEHKILRPMGDPRIHFALNCASLGCPALPPVPFYPETLDEQLDEEAIKFIHNPQKVRLDRETRVLNVSALFSWFKDDFLVVSGGIPAYIQKYIAEDEKNFLEANAVSVKVLKYDWSLNAQ